MLIRTVFRIYPYLSKNMFEFLNKFKTAPKLRIVYNGHPALRRKAEPIGAIDEEVRDFARQLTSALLNSEVKGVGLAAPQVGVSKRMIALDTCPSSGRPRANATPGEMLLEPKMPLVLINPEIVDKSVETDVANEGCLSLPGVSGDVTRPVSVLLSATTIDGEQFTVECGGLLGRCLQHEIDHLDGVLFYDHLSAAEQKANAKTMKDLAKFEKSREKA